MDYERLADALTWTKELDGLHHLQLRAELIRRERTGIHARLSILMNGVVLAWDSINVEKDADRVHLCNAYMPHLNDTTATYPSYPKPHAKKDLDLFCAGLWDEVVGQNLAEDVGGFEEAHPPIEVVPEFVQEGGGTILFGPPEHGKSWITMAMAVSVDAGCHALWDVQPRKALFVNLERDADSVRNRLGLINRALGLPASRPIAMLNRRGKSLADVANATERSVRERDIDVVFLDSITRSGAGDLNANETANKIIDILNGMCRTWVAIAHTARADASHAFGSQMFDAAADILVRTHSEVRGEERGVGLLRTKGNDLPPMRQLQAIALRFVEGQGLVGMRKARLAEFPDMLVAKKEGNVDTIIRYLKEVTKATATEVAKETGLDRSMIARLFQDSPFFTRSLKIGREVFYGLTEDV